MKFGDGAMKFERIKTMNSMRLRNTIKVVAFLAAVIFQFVIVPNTAFGETAEEKYSRLTPEQKKQVDTYSDQAEKLQFPVFFGDKTMEDAQGVLKYLTEKYVPLRYQAMVAFMHRDTNTLKSLVANNDRRYQAESLFYLGMCHEHGLGCGKDCAAAAQMYRKASNLGYGAARFCLAHLYANGDGVKRDYEEASALLALAEAKAEVIGKALIWGERRQIDAFRAANAFEEQKYDDFWRFSKTADRDNRGIQVMLGYCLENGLGCEADLDEAANWYAKAKEQGHEMAGEFAMRVDGLRAGEALRNKRYDDFWRFSKTADRDDPKLQVMLGFCCENGLGCKVNLDEAAKWYGKAKKQGDKDGAAWAMRVDTKRTVEAGVNKRFDDFWRFSETADRENPQIQAMLGVGCEEGLGCEKNLDEAAKWYARALKQGYEKVEGPLRRVNTKRALLAFEAKRWKEGLRLVETADKDNKELQYYLGYCHEYGIEMQKNLTKAVSAYEHAAKKGFAVAQYRYGKCLENGVGGDANPKEALVWLEKAAAQGLVEAMMECAAVFEHGKGTDKNPLKAEEYCRRAAAKGNRGAASEVMRLVTARAKRAFESGNAEEGNRLLGDCDKADAEIQYRMAEYKFGISPAIPHVKSTDAYDDALEWCRKAVAQNHTSAGRLLVEIETARAKLAFSLKDWAKAMSIVPLANQGDPEILYYCGLCHEEGHGVRQDLEKALPFYEAALAKGHDKAKGAVKRVKKGIAEYPKKFRDALSALDINLNEAFPWDQVVVAGSNRDISQLAEKCPDGSIILLNAGDYMLNWFRKRLRIIGISPDKTRIMLDESGMIAPRDYLMLENLTLEQQNRRSYINMGAKPLILNNCRLDGVAIEQKYGCLVMHNTVVDMNDSKLSHALALGYLGDKEDPPMRAAIIDSRICNVDANKYGCAIEIGSYNRRWLYCDGLVIDNCKLGGIGAGFHGECSICLHDTKITNIKRGFFTFDDSYGHGILLGHANAILENVTIDNCSSEGIIGNSSVYLYNVKTTNIGISNQLHGPGIRKGTGVLGVSIEKFFATSPKDLSSLFK